jgi:hypothetical protein
MSIVVQDAPTGSLAEFRPLAPKEQRAETRAAVPFDEPPRTTLEARR